MELQPISTAPRDGSWIILFGPSGYTSTPLRCEVCQYVKYYFNPWRTYDNAAFVDGGGDPTHWCPVPEIT